ncbi:cytochrome P450 CYP12A2-like [Aethina tumida]|uniref:cytochrome P450 CYP12A2-like n=1 Tax=Aethina tumida TaxID=116153 RepID=UPI002149764A|nr:cytochrome P450 CYP12A2-like [Aethina tumida]
MIFKRLFSHKCAKPFSQVPSLKSYPLIGHTYLFLPGGPYKTERLTETVLDISKKLGPIFKLNLGGMTLVITTNADDTQLMYRNEGVRPHRPPFPALAHCRKKEFNSCGVVPGNGEEWYKFRTGVVSLLKPGVVSRYTQRHEIVAKNFIKYLDMQKDSSNVVEDLFEHLQRFTIEAISVVCPGVQFKCIHNENLQFSDIMNASKNFMDGLYSTLMGPPIWKIIKTDGYKKLESSHKVIYNVMKDHLNNLKIKYEQDAALVEEENPFMYALFQNDNMSWDDKIMLSMEVFFGGIDTTATTIALTLHYLAENERTQSIARNDTKSEDLRYLRACVKETLRLSPTAGANSRFLIRDTEIGGYLIPKNTLVSAFSSVTCCDEKYFKNAKEFKPERWLREKKENYHKFASLPFGYGPRMCPGKRLAENEMVLLIKEILLNYKLELPNESTDIGMIYRMNRVPDQPVNIKFVPLS